jgi:DNA polymerase IV
MPGRVMLHVDMDAYFASVETLGRPELAGRPVLVAGDPTLRTVVTSCSYEAKARGVKSGMPLLKALRLVPEAAVVEGDFNRYTTYTKRILAVLLAVTHRVEPVSIDEAFLEATGLPGEPGALALGIQRGILEKTGLWASVGIGPNKLLAKMASKKAKPRGVRRLDPDDITGFRVDSIWGVGPETARLLNGFGIRTVGDLRSFPRDRLRLILGMPGESLYFLCRGVDPSPLIPFYEDPEAFTIGHEHTFSRDVRKPSEYLPILALMAQKVARRARDEGQSGSLVTLKYRLSNLRHLSRSRRLGNPTDQDQLIFKTAMELALEAVDRPIRLIGVSLGALAGSSGLQLQLFTDRTAGLNGAADAVRLKYGERAITSCRTLAVVRRRGGAGGTTAGGVT